MNCRINTTNTQTMNDELTTNPSDYINTSDICEQCGLIFNRPIFNMKEVVICANEEEKKYLGIKASELTLIRIDSVAFRDRRDIRKSLALFYGVLHAMRERFLYIIRSRNHRIELYLGISQEGSPTNRTNAMGVNDLTHSLLGVMPGCQAEAQTSVSANKELMKDTLRGFNYSYLMTGVPTCQVALEKRDQHQEEEKAHTGIERLIDSMDGSDFALTVLCEPLSDEELGEFRSRVGELHNLIKPLARQQESQNFSVAQGSSTGQTDTDSETIGTSNSTGNSESNSSTDGTSSGENTSRGVKEGNVLSRGWKGLGRFIVGGESVNITSSKQEGRSHSVTKQTGTTTTEGTNHSTTHSVGTTNTESFTQTNSLGINRERTNMEMATLSSQLEKLQKRLTDAVGEGMWKTSIMFHANEENVLKRAAFAAASIWSGADSAIDPIRCLRIEKGQEVVRTQAQLMDLNFTIGAQSNEPEPPPDDQSNELAPPPDAQSNEPAPPPDDQSNELALPPDDQSNEPVHPLGRAYSNLYTCLTHKELAHIADLPHWDLPGVTVQPLVEYARCSPENTEDESIELGGLIDRTTIDYKDEASMLQRIRLSYDQLNKHCFVSGVTGSGKSTTMRRLLREVANHHQKPIPFMVIEPAKTEYRELRDEIDDLVVYSLGRRNCDFALNPFSFGEGTSLFSHLDFLKSAFNALLGSYSSMPFILETILCKCYEAKGWDLSTGENKRYAQMHHIPSRAGRRQFRESLMPKISDMEAQVDDVLTDFFGEDKSDYRISLRGALKARLNSLTMSMKGKLLNSEEKIPFEDLMEKKVVFELEAFADNDEKAFIMSLLLGRIYQIRQAEYQRAMESGDKLPHGLRHIVVLEEAHRLLAKSEGKGELQANPRAKAVETFSDMLAEVRSYGQGLIIVDQIPSKLTPEVMKNTEVKIVHRLLAKDDREVVGATMNLQKDQIEDLARHKTGEATMYFGNLLNALHVKIKK